MQHLPTDRLAALADEAPSPDESAHLALCAACAGEVRAYETLLAMAQAEGGAGGAGHLDMPLTRWDAIAAELHAGRRPAARPARPFGVPAWAQRAAAAVLLVIGGAVGGRLTAGAPAAAGGEQVARRVDPPVVKPSKPGTSKPASPIELAPQKPGSDVQVASYQRPSVDSLLPMTFASVEDARLWMQRFENAYQNAAAFVAANDTTGRTIEPGSDDRVYRARLAALDRAGRVMREALRDAPEDPVINGYYLTTLGQREATLRQINVSAAAGQRVIGF